MQKQETEATEEIIMPLYEHICMNGHKFDRFLKLRELDGQQVCECGSIATRLISAPMFSIDATNFVPYESPTTGKWISSKVQRREDMKASGCVEYEPSMKDEMLRRHKAEDEALDKKIDEHVEKEIYSMDTRSRERLVSELEGGVDASVVRV